MQFVWTVTSCDTLWTHFLWNVSVVACSSQSSKRNFFICFFPSSTLWTVSYISLVLLYRVAHRLFVCLLIFLRKLTTSQKISCLRTFRPPNCPLCRQYFFSDQIKRLHVDRLEPDKEKQIDFLNQIILGWCEMNDQQFEVLLSPVQSWLAPRDVHEVCFVFPLLLGLLPLVPSALWLNADFLHFFFVFFFVVWSLEKGCRHIDQVSAT